MTLVVLRLPMPPSINALWRAGKGRVYSSEKYKNWKRDAGWALKQQRPQRIKGQYFMEVQMCRPRKNSDLDNYAKAIGDLLQAHGVIENDKFVMGVTLAWGLDQGCLVTLEAAS